MLASCEITAEVYSEQPASCGIDDHTTITAAMNSDLQIKQMTLCMHATSYLPQLMLLPLKPGTQA